MDKNSYRLLNENWQYIHPGLKGLVLIDYHFERGVEVLKLFVNYILKNKNFFYWLPRVTGIIFVSFISIFALDVFTGSNSLVEILQGLFIHLIPSLILLILLGISWKFERVGGSIFVLTFIVVFALIITRKPLITDLVVFGPLLLIGSLFILDSYIRHIYKN